MLKLRTNAESTVFKPATIPAGSNVCTYTYDEYNNQRVIKTANSQDIKDSTNLFKTSILAPLNALNPNLEMGEYFVIPVSEILELLSSTNNTAEFIHIYNAVRKTTNIQGESKSFPVAVLVPVTKQIFNGSDVYANCEEDDTVYVEAYPCPPAAGCPNSSVIHKNILSETNSLNNFNALF